ncbi:hypothetical protein [Dongia rigui]|uniref:Uncharacterized protein n=1 Tax=Dongia rigui TaxID=940149 RepID=A0ABU5DZX1_9PROT|nr:hypothetical protein [Dongia rigui]MDY0872829.1 hypothetical protein [Dongia rigui]
MKNSLARLLGTTAGKIAEAAAGTAAEILSGQTPVERLYQRHAEAVTARDAAQTKFTAANLAAELTPDEAAAGSARDRARSALAQAQERVDALASAIAAAKDGEAVTAAAQAAAERARRWDAAGALAKQREGIASEIEQLAAALAEKFSQLQDVTTQVAAAMPYRPDTAERTGTSLILPELEIAARYALTKAGLRWAANWPWEMKDLPTLSKRMADATAQLVQLRKAKG